MDRQSIERSICRRIVKDAIAAGLRVSVHDGEEYVICRSKSVDKVMALLMATDEERLFFSAEDGKRMGWVYLVYGNDGWDVVNDYTTNLAPILDGAMTYADELEEKYG